MSTVEGLNCLVVSSDGSVGVYVDAEKHLCLESDSAIIELLDNYCRGEDDKPPMFFQNFLKAEMPVNKELSTIVDFAYSDANPCKNINIIYVMNSWSVFEWIYSKRPNLFAEIEKDERFIVIAKAIIARRSPDIIKIALPDTCTNKAH